MIRNALILTLLVAAAAQAEQGVSISHAADLDTVYQAVLNQVKRDGAEIESASKDAGIKTAVTVTGHYKQTGSYLGAC